MKTAKDILETVTCNWCRELTEARAIQAMEEYAKSNANLFATYLRENWRNQTLYGKDLPPHQWRRFQDDKIHTTEQLYELFEKNNTEMPYIVNNGVATKEYKLSKRKQTKQNDNP